MQNGRFWIVGGEFTSTDFNQVIEGTQQVVGPMECRKKAEQLWRNMSEQDRSQCNVRYSIVSEPAFA